MEYIKNEDSCKSTGHVGRLSPLFTLYMAAALLPLHASVSPVLMAGAQRVDAQGVGTGEADPTDEQPLSFEQSRVSEQFLDSAIAGMSPFKRTCFLAAICLDDTET